MITRLQSAHFFSFYFYLFLFVRFITSTKLICVTGYESDEFFHKFEVWFTTAKPEWSIKRVEKSSFQNVLHTRFFSNDISKITIQTDHLRFFSDKVCEKVKNNCHFKKERNHYFLEYILKKQLSKISSRKKRTFVWRHSDLIDLGSGMQSSIKNHHTYHFRHVSI